jgi:secreted PhoX family phosphatase
MSHPLAHADSQPTNPSPNEHLHDVLARSLQRRQVLKLGAGSAAAAFLAGPSALAATPARPQALLGFKSVAASTADAVRVPEPLSCGQVMVSVPG